VAGDAAAGEDEEAAGEVWALAADGAAEVGVVCRAVEGAAEVGAAAGEAGAAPVRVR
jgi:hypothetical protein